jgi:predicted NUDIX family phosphoesterase
MATIHKKIWRECFEKIISGKKKTELRLADFKISEGDTLVLEEWDKDKKEYTGRKVEAVAAYILKTKGQTFWPAEEVEKYGFQIIQFEPKLNTAEPAFKAREGQVDYTNMRYAPVINCVVRHNDAILIVQRNSKMRLYPNFWNGISGFLDDRRSIEEKVKDELREELGIEANDIISIHRGPVFDQEEEKYGKTWIVHPILVDVKTDKIKLNWEAQNYKWIKVEEAKTFDLLPGFDKVLTSLFS